MHGSARGRLGLAAAAVAGATVGHAIGYLAAASGSPKPTGATPWPSRPGFAISESPAYVVRGVAALA